MINGWRRESDDVSAAHPSIDLIREGLNNAAGSSYVNIASDLRGFSPGRHDQLSSGSCVAQSAIRALEIKRIIKYGPEAHVPLSRLALYYLARERMSPQETNKDEGTLVYLVGDVLKDFGVCREDRDVKLDPDLFYWPFDLDKVYVSPTWMAMRDAFLHKIQTWYRIQSTGTDRVNDVILALAAGNPVIYGTAIGNQWSSYGRGSKPIRKRDGSLLGRHATVLEGWDPSRSLFYGENSWGNVWGVAGPDGSGGFYEMEPSVIEDNDSADFTVIVNGWEEWAKI